MIMRDTATGAFEGIRCDTCGLIAPPAPEISKAGGLVAMGWYCSGGTHICPDHEHPADGWPKRPAVPVMRAGGRGDA